MLEKYGECIDQEYNREKLHMKFRRLYGISISCRVNLDIFPFLTAPTREKHRRTMAELEDMEAGGAWLKGSAAKILQK